MLLENYRKKIVDYGKKLIDMNLTVGTAGNLSIYDREKSLMVISPSGMDYFSLSPEDVVVMDLKGEVVDGNKKPSSEYHLHSIFYKNRSDIDAIIHTHTTYSTAIACLGEDLQPVHYTLASAGTRVRCAKYATYGTMDLAQNAYEAMEGSKAVLLQNHGLISGGKNIQKALEITKDVEYCAKLYYIAKSIGTPKIIPDDEMVKITEKFKSYGQKAKSIFEK